MVVLVIWVISQLTGVIGTITVLCVLHCMWCGVTPLPDKGSALVARSQKVCKTGKSLKQSAKRHLAHDSECHMSELCELYMSGLPV